LTKQQFLTLLVPTVAYRGNASADLSAEVIFSRPTDVCDVVARDVGTLTVGITCASWQNSDIRVMYNVASP